MEISKIVLSILFIGISVFFVNKTVTGIFTEKLVLLRIVIIFVTALLCLYIIDIVVFSEKPLMSDEHRAAILDVVKYLLLGIGAIYFYNQKKE